MILLLAEPMGGPKKFVEHLDKPFLSAPGLVMESQLEEIVQLLIPTRWPPCGIALRLACVNYSLNVGRVKDGT
jgi:hypothetical protein